METPVFKISNFTYMKMENFNPGGSHKSRAARYMVKNGMKNGLIKSDTTIIEKTGGNLGIGLAIEGAKNGIRVELAVGLSFSPHKRKLMEFYGAKLIGHDMLLQGAQPKEVIEYHLANSDKLNKNYYFIDQFNNESNFQAHYEETGSEIYDFLQKNNLLNNKIIFAAGIGSGASISGIGQHLKEKMKHIEIIGIMPDGCDIDSASYCKHDFQGIAVGVKPKIFRNELVDRYIHVNEEQAFKLRKEFAQKSGLFIGNSSAANLLGTRMLENEYKNEKPVIISLIYDSGDSYLN